ncbi:MAG: hypothetical protein KIS61_10425 [Candidatus Eremiobacteraeota bacterium]|nr:hypothetical protein [Candidatus Eremiobacteraeota bacterium]
MRRRGNSLLTTLVWIALIVCLAFGLAGLTVSHLSSINYQDNRQQAKHMARSVVSTAIARIMQDTEFGKSAKPSGLLQVQSEAAIGRLSFEKDHGVPYSTNNLEQPNSTHGSEGQAVPKNSAYLIGVGTCGGVTQRVTAILAVPPFPYAIAASGSVEARGGLTIGSLNSLPDGPIPNSSTFLPADLLANQSGSQSVFLGSDTHVSGDVRSAGDIVLDPSAPPESIQVKGQLRSNSAPEKIPTIELSHYDPLINGSQYNSLTQAIYGNGQTKLSGINRREGPMTVQEGLFLDGANLFVHGDLNVLGGLTGKGVLVVDGNVTISGQSDFDSSNGMAVLSSHDFRISGSDPSGSYFQGLVYTEGSFNADKVTLVGSLVAAGEPKPVKLTETRIFQLPPPVESAQPLSPSSPAPSPIFSTTSSNGLSADFTVNGNTLHIEIHSSPPAILDVPFGPGGGGGPQAGGFQALYAPDGPVYSFFAQHNFGPSTNITGVLTTIDNYLHENGTSGGTVTGPAVIQINDPSSFLKLNERIRIVMWKEE